MPEHGCTDCDLFHNNYGYYLCPIIGEDVRQNVESENRHINCPLVEIPTPHGDLIDRDLLMACYSFQPFNESRGEWEQFEIVRDEDILKAPTVIESEE